MFRENYILFCEMKVYLSKGEMNMKKSEDLKEITTKKLFDFKKGKILLILFPLIICVFLFILFNLQNNKEKETKVITVSTLEKIINVSELSTFTAVYNGIATVNNEKKVDKIEYYVSYDAKVEAGIDFTKLDIEVDNGGKIITIKIPEIYITEINVDVSSLDFIFINDKANTSTVSEQAFKACEDDVKEESEKQTAIYDLARQNAINILTALTKPVIEQLDEEYELIIS